MACSQRLTRGRDCLCSNCKTRKGRNCKAFGLHKFRKTFATKLSQAGVPIQDIKEALGHADIQTTMDYLGISPKKRRRENVAAAFPQRKPVVRWGRRFLQSCQRSRSLSAI
jgi:integrase